MNIIIPRDFIDYIVNNALLPFWRAILVDKSPEGYL